MCCFAMTWHSQKTFIQNVQMAKSTHLRNFPWRMCWILFGRRTGSNTIAIWSSWILQFGTARSTVTTRQSILHSVSDGISSSSKATRLDAPVHVNPSACANASRPTGMAHGRSPRRMHTDERLPPMLHRLLLEQSLRQWTTCRLHSRSWNF